MIQSSSKVEVRRASGESEKVHQWNRSNHSSSVHFTRQPCSSCILRGSPGACELPAAASRSGSSRRKAADGSSRSNAKHRRLSDQPSPPLYRRPELSSYSRSVESESSNLDAASLLRRITNLESQLGIHLQDSRCCAASTHNNLVPSQQRNDVNWLADEHLDALLAALPSQRDCEMILEYLLQEADWLVAYLDAPQMEHIWSRFVDGAHVTWVESAVIASAIALGICILSDSPHIFYTPSIALDAFPSALIEYAQRYLNDHERMVPKAPLLATSTLDTLHELLVLALLNDCFPFRAHVTGDREPPARHIIHRLQQSVGFLDESSAFWQRLDGGQRECLRRLGWHFVNFERWMSIYVQYMPANPFCRVDIQLSRPRYVSTPLKAPLRGSSTADDGGRLAFRRPLKGSARVFRVKDEQEVRETSIIAGLFNDLSAHCLAVSHYISALEAWRRDRASAAPANTRHDPASDRQRAELLDQASALCRDLKRWKEEIPVCSIEVARLDTGDYSHCRRASQAAVVYTGVRQLLNIVLGAWVTEHSIWYRPEEEETSSVVPHQQQQLLQTLQWEAFDNARGVVRSVDTVRKLVLSGTSVQTPWIAMSLFDAAKTLAIPLLSAIRRPRGESKVDRMADEEAEEIYPQVVRIDRPLEIQAIQITAAEGEQLSQRIHSGAGTTHAKPMNAQRKSEMRRLAADLLCLLDLLSLFRNNLLGSEARKRLATLIDTFSVVHGGGARRKTGDSAGFHTQLMNSTTFQTNLSDDAPSKRHWEDAAAFEPASADIESNKAVLESLIGQNDAWWNELLSWQEIEGRQGSHA